MSEDNNQTKFTVHISGDTDSYTSKPMHFKAAAGYVSKVIQEDNVRYTWWGEPFLTKSVSILDKSGIQPPLVEITRHGTIYYAPDFLQGNEFPAAFYVKAAMRNAFNEHKKDANEWLTPTQIEEMLNLNPGVVRKHLHDTKDWEPPLKDVTCEDLFKKVDGRTWLVKKGYALCRWGKNGLRIAEDTIDWNKLLPKGWNTLGIYDQLCKLNYTPSDIQGMAEYAQTETIEFSPGIFGRVIQVSYPNNAPFFEVYTTDNGYRLNIREGDTFEWSLKNSHILSNDLGPKIKLLSVMLRLP